jgi:outer membrane protein insertion porin family
VLRLRLLSLLAAVALLLTPALPALAQFAGYVDDIQVEGNQRIEADTVRSYMSIAPGDPYDPGRVNQSLKALFATGLFADVAVRRQGGALIVSVVENPIINRLAFEGNSRIQDRVLEQEVQLRPRVVYTRSRVQSDVQRILQVYRRSGRFAATVVPKVIQLEQNRVDLVFEINEGPLTGVARIDFIGNRAFSDGRLKDAIATKESRWYRFLSSDDTYDPDRLTLDRELLRKYYLSRGHADFRVTSAVAELAPDRENFYITFTVEEGPVYRFGKIDLTTSLRNLDAERLRSVVTTLEGETYSAEEIEKSIVDLTFELGRLGYAFVDIRPGLDRNRDGLTIGVTYEINEGPRVYVERINITGNVRTLDEVIRREFRLNEGDAFNAAKLRRSRERIRGLGFFDKVEVTQEPGSAPDQVVVNADVQERSTGELSFGAGISTTESVIGDIALRERNLLGRGQDLRLGLSLSSRRQQIDISFTEPYFLDRNLRAGFDIFDIRRDLQEQSSIDEQERGFRLRTSFEYNERLSQLLRYTLRQAEISNFADDVSPLLLRDAGEETTSSLGYELVYDVRDDILEPRSGYVLRGGQDFAGFGGNVTYVKSTASMSWFYPFADEFTGNIGLRAGYIDGLGDDVSVTSRFFLGGDSLRGFEPGGVGPRDSDTDDSLGGNFFYAATAELYFPLGIAKEFGITGRTFTEIGSLYSIDVSGPTLLDEASPRLSVGAGISWNSPFGPIRLDLAQALVKETFDKEQLFRFSFGTRF